LAGQPAASIGRLSPPPLLLILVDGICELRLRLRLVLSALVLSVLLLLPAAVVCQSDERRGVHHHPKIELAI
jgi:hypothetical protein